MMTLKQFAKLCDSYGAELQRWPDKQRPGAEALLQYSAEACDLLAAAARLDRTIGVPERADDPAALVRLRVAVNSRLDHPRPAFWRLPWSFAELGLATGGGIAVVAGFLVGWSTTAPPPPATLLGTLQPLPIELPIE
jgi:hypothetical protein